jgi:hypothetical protein
VTRAAADEDGDGSSNLEEFRHQTDPWLPNRWTFAEGGSGNFTVRFAVVNPGAAVASGVAMFRTSGGERRVSFSVPPRSRATIDVGQVLGAGTDLLSSVIEVERGGAFVERTMRLVPAIGQRIRLDRHHHRGLHGPERRRRPSFL